MSSIRDRRFVFAAALIAASVALSCAPRPPVRPAVRPPLTEEEKETKRRPPREEGRAIESIRVALRLDVPELEVRLPGGARLRADDGEVDLPAGIARFRANGASALTVEAAGGSRSYDGSVTLVPGGDGTFEIGDRPYSGALRALSGPSGLTAVNVIGLEEYLRGVVPWEIGWLPEEKIEALKAQAVAARTYALMRIGAVDGDRWDLVATESDQVYRGLERTDEVVDRAIHETAGVVATYRGELLRTYYSSTCGGRMADLTEVWFGREGAPYLHGGGDGPGGSSRESSAYCRASPHFRWTETWSGDEAIGAVVRALAAEQGVDPAMLGAFRDVRVEEKGGSGRVTSTLFETENADVRIPGDRVRWVLLRPGNRGILRSTWFTLKVKRSGGKVVEIVAEGRGHGHGIGMCQWGAMGMADEGLRYDEILRHYYPGVRLRQATTALLPERP